jgi:hypothetical protein
LGDYQLQQQVTRKCQGYNLYQKGVDRRGATASQSLSGHNSRLHGQWLHAYQPLSGTDCTPGISLGDYQLQQQVTRKCQGYNLYQKGVDRRGAIGHAKRRSPRISITGRIRYNCSQPLHKSPPAFPSWCNLYQKGVDRRGAIGHAVGCCGQIMTEKLIGLGIIEAPLTAHFDHGTNQIQLLTATTQKPSSISVVV